MKWGWLVKQLCPPDLHQNWGSTGLDELGESRRFSQAAQRICALVLWQPRNRACRLLSQHGFGHRLQVIRTFNYCTPLYTILRESFIDKIMPLRSRDCTIWCSIRLRFIPLFFGRTGVWRSRCIGQGLLGFKPEWIDRKVSRGPPIFPAKDRPKYQPGWTPPPKQTAQQCCPPKD